MNQGTQKLEEMMNALRDEKLGSEPPAKVKRGDILLGQFTADDTWYRARVESINRENGKHKRFVFDNSCAFCLTRRCVSP